MENNIAYSRVDSRLLHGQVITSWKPKFGITKFVVVDENAASDPFLKMIITSVAPKGTDSQIVTPGQAGELFRDGKFSGGRYMILFKDIQNVYNAYQAGMEISELCLGNMPGTDATKSIYRAVHITEQDAQRLLELERKGMSIYCAEVPKDVHLPLDTALSKNFGYLLK